MSIYVPVEVVFTHSCFYMLISIFISSWRIPFSISCKAELVVMKSLDFFFVLWNAFLNNFAGYDTLSWEVCSHRILNNHPILSPGQKLCSEDCHLGSLVCGESTFLFILSKSVFFLTFDNLIMILSVAFLNVI